jgi:hypothetical protein
MSKAEFSPARMMALAWTAKESDLTEAEYAKVLAYHKEIAEAQGRLDLAEQLYTIEAQAAEGDSRKIYAVSERLLKVRVDLLRKQRAFWPIVRTFRKQTGLIELAMSCLAWLRVPQAVAWQQEKDRQRKADEVSAARLKWRLFHESKTMDEVSRMSGTQFEEFLARLFSRMGYTEIRLTPPNDQGGDVLCTSPAGTRIVIQAKRWRDTVGNSAVQELLGAMLHYNLAEGMVVTNSRFTRAAHELAKKGRITLHDGGWLEEQIKQCFPSEIPEFNWEEYNKSIKGFHPFRVGITATGISNCR